MASNGPCYGGNHIWVSRKLYASVYILRPWRKGAGKRGLERGQQPGEGLRSSAREITARARKKGLITVVSLPFLLAILLDLRWLGECKFLEILDEVFSSPNHCVIPINDMTRRPLWKCFKIPKQKFAAKIIQCSIYYTPAEF